VGGWAFDSYIGGYFFLTSERVFKGGLIYVRIERFKDSELYWL